jgi:hypothetical protein
MIWVIDNGHYLKLNLLLFLVKNFCKAEEKLVIKQRKNSEVKEPTRCDKVCSFYCLNMFRAPICPSSGVQLVNIFRF